MNEHRSGPRRPVIQLAVITALAAGLGLAPPAAVAAPQERPTVAAEQTAPEVALPGLGAGVHAVTLVTGDQLRLTGNGAGQFTVSVAKMAPRPDGYPAATVKVTSGGAADGTAQGAVYAVPSDVAAAVDAGRVDRTLFDLAYLAEHDLLDATSAQVPVILGYRAGSSGFAKAEALPASDATLALRSVDGAAVTVDKAKAADFWSSVHATPNAATLSGGVQSVWLDATAELSLDESVPLIGAPQAWASGLDGTGTTVAVLDSGVDLGHPDLAGRIVVSESFVPGETVQDLHGHGTHVATTIAGTGAASAGKYKGVAPGAKLAIGKVCALAECSNSAVMAGMEWAVAQGVDVVSMSLGGGHSDGNDPLSLTVSRLTEQSGTLFVIAAGNEGPKAGTVGAPGTAEAALTVAASTKQDGLADFSSRGPRIDGALKPDIAAPGVGIVAGRAAGTTMGTPVNDRYTSANGTSMATPHVAGAVAILAQQHPDWQAGALKAALMSTSKDIGFTSYEVGAGRVDIARAVSQQVVATTPAVDFGGIEPGRTTEPVAKEITYANHGDVPVTLTLSRTLRLVGGDTVPGEVFTGGGEVTVPAHGTASTTVTLDPAPLAIGRYSGAVTAVDASGAVTLRTPVGADRQPEKFELVMRLLDNNGQPACMLCGTLELTAVDVAGVGGVVAMQTAPGLFQAWVEKGTYSGHGEVRWMDPATSQFNKAVIAKPQFTVTGRSEITFDARTAKEVRMRAPKPAQTYGQTLTWSRSSKGEGLLTSITIGAFSFGQQRLWVAPTERVTVGAYRFGVARLLSNTQIAMRVTGKDGFDLRLFHRGYADQGKRSDGGAQSWTPWPKLDDRIELVDVGYGTPTDLAGRNLRGKLALLRWGDDRFGPDYGAPDGQADSAIWTDRVRAVASAGARGYVAVSAPPAGWEDHYSFGSPTDFIEAPPAGPAEITLPEVQLARDQGAQLIRRLAKGKVWSDVTVDRTSATPTSSTRSTKDRSPRSWTPPSPTGNCSPSTAPTTARPGHW